ncbi:MAG: hypothetical protein ACTHKZ_01415 [Lysobacteraceae bacterium]
MNTRSLLAAPFALLAASAWAQSMDMPMPDTPAAPAEAPAAGHAHHAHDAHDAVRAPAAPPAPPAIPGMAPAHAPMAMQGALGAYPMSREGSGTSWLPDASPLEGIHLAHGDWTAMLHATVFAATGESAGPRGGRDGFVESMFMAMAQRPAGGGVLGLRAMASLDPWLVGGDGYRLLLQSGETADGRVPLVDRQHPHDALMELSASYMQPLGAHANAFVYLGLPGEPALGPPAFMHRVSAADDPEAPLGHHWLDATHISYGVATLGWTWRGLRIEGSRFNGREPDQHRTDIELRALDSWSGRVSWNPGEHWALQASHGALRAPEQLEPGIDMTRTTASAIHQRGGAGWQWQSTLAWGRNRKHPGGRTDAWLLESALRWQERWTLFGRAERVGKDELFDEGEPLHGRTFDVGKLTLGALRDFRAGPGRMGIGAQYSWHALPSALDDAYGDDPGAWRVFARWRLGRD